MRLIHPAGAIITGLFLTMAACVPAESPDQQLDAGADEAASTQADVEAIDSLRVWFAEAMTAGDVDGMMSNYVEDAVEMPPNEPALTGKGAIRARHEMFRDQYVIRLDNPSDETMVVGDVAILRGSYDITLEPREDGPVIRDNGKYLVTWLRQADGAWLAAHEIWNTDNPLPEGRPLAQ
ncbi:MAG: DUF4440 domain-containing protein [Gemmatimonadota bacterium]